mgnify:CR=1 FL=1
MTEAIGAPLRRHVCQTTMLAATDMLTLGTLGDNHTGADSAIGHPIDDDKGTGGVVSLIVVIGDRPLQRQLDSADFVQAQLGCALLFQRIDVDSVLNAGEGAGAVVVARLISYLRPGCMGCSAIHTRVASNWSPIRGC